MVAWGGSQDTRAAGCCTGASRDRSSGVIACGGTARIGTAVWGDCLGGQPSSEGSTCASCERSRKHRLGEHIGDKLSSGGFQGYF